MRFILTTMLLASFFWACSDSIPDTAGATSETTNGIAFTVVDASRMPIAHARLTLYSKTDISVQGVAETDSLGKAYFDTLASDGFVEGIAGEDSSLMSWAPLDTEQTEISLLPSARLTVRTGATADNFARLFDSIALESTPYAALRNGGEYVFSHVPVGIFNIVAEDSLLATVSLENGSTSDTLFHVPGITHEFVFEDFDDGDSLNNLAKIYPNYGWYFSTTGNVRWIRPDSSVDYKKALIDDSTKGKILSLKFDIKDFGYVLIGTHLGRDTAYYDLSNLTAIRLKVRGDCDLGIALEHYREVGNNTYRKALWNAKASKEWTEIVLRPGKEVLDNESLQVPWTEVSKEIGIFSIFASNGTFIELDEIVFEGIDPDSLKN